MSEAGMTLLVRCAGAVFIVLALLHFPIARYLRWREELPRLSPINAAVFRVHTFFIRLILVLMALPCLADPGLFLEKSRAGLWLTWSFAAFWFARLMVQLFMYPAEVWRGKGFETVIHRLFTLLWSALTLLFAWCAATQSGWLA